MIAEKVITVETADGNMPVFCAWLDRDEKFPVGVLYMDALGIREELRAMTRFVASKGYFAVLPDLFYRAGEVAFDPSTLPDFVDPKMLELNFATSIAMIGADTGSLIQHLKIVSNARTGSMGSIGFCMGGRHAIAASGKYPDFFRAAASLHGGFLVNDEPDSAHLMVPKTKGGLYFGFAENDDTAPKAHLDAITEAIGQSQAEGIAETHEGALHGFMFPERYCFHKSASDASWSRWFDLMEQHVRQSQASLHET